MTGQSWAWLALLVAVAPLATGVAAALPRPVRTARAPVRFNRIAAAVGCAAAIILLSWPWSVIVGSATALAAWRLLPAQLSTIAVERQLAIARELPEVADLLAALLRTGMPDASAVGRVAVSVGDPLGPMLTAVARNRRLGAGARVSWGAFLTDPALTQLGQVMIRHAETGSGVATALDRVATDARGDYFSQAQAAARAAAVRAVIPLAVCFLPAFFLLGVAPIVASLFAGLQL